MYSLFLFCCVCSWPINPLEKAQIYFSNLAVWQGLFSQAWLTDKYFSFSESTSQNDESSLSCSAAWAGAPVALTSSMNLSKLLNLSTPVSSLQNGNSNPVCSHGYYKYL